MSTEGGIILITLVIVTLQRFLRIQRVLMHENLLVFDADIT